MLALSGLPGANFGTMRRERESRVARSEFGSAKSEGRPANCSELREAEAYS